MISKKEFAEALQKGQIKLIYIGRGYNKEYQASYNRYRIYINDEPLESRNCDWYREIPYFSKRSELLAMTVWGVSQEFQATYVLACIAQKELDDIPKSHREFCKWFQDRIKVQY